jgi:hypothetical protein
MPLSSPRVALPVCATAASLLLWGAAVAVPTPEPVGFERGTNGATLAGELTPDAPERRYRLSALAGQMLVARLRTAPDGVRLRVRAPDGGVASRAATERDFAGRLPAGGPYEIAVSAGGGAGEAAPYVLDVSVTGRPARARSGFTGAYARPADRAALQVRALPGGRAEVQLGRALRAVLPLRGDVATYQAPEGGNTSCRVTLAFQNGGRSVSVRPAGNCGADVAASAGLYRRMAGTPKFSPAGL